MIWEKQWELFAPNFKNGKAHIDLQPYGEASILELYAGPGFGDLSHPTTRLVLQLMPPYVKDHPVIDIGCGSGILSLAAAAMGATKIDGYDIDPEAVEHAKNNLKLSPFADKVHFSLTPPKKITSNTVFLMNMISSEQQQAWPLISKQIQTPALLITSGILEENESDYLAWRNSQVIASLREDGWSCFVFNLS
jgi:ribosomal protein L11 methyltransferase